MTLYPNLVLPFGLVGLYVGLENVILFAIRRRRLHLWVGLLGLFTCPYVLAAFAVYTAGNLEAGRRWQRWELTFATVLVYVLGILGFEFIGRLKRAPVAILTAATVLNCVLLWVPGVGLSHAPAIKTIGWLRATYWEVELGPSSQLYFGITVGVLGWVVLQAARRSRHAAWPDRWFVAVLAVWFAAAVNDTAVALRLYESVYVTEFAFALMGSLFATLLIGEMHRNEVQTAQKSRELARDAILRDRQLAAAQAELTEAAKLAVVGRLAAGVAHEVNNPLSYIINNLIMLRDGMPDGDDRLDMAKDALEGAVRIKEVVAQLSAFSRPAESGSCGRVKTAVDIAAKLGSFELKSRAEIRTEIPWDLVVQLEEERLAQVLLNLFVNAAQSIAPGHRTQNRVHVRAAADGEWVRITVEDTGTGIPQEVLPNIFDPFFSLKPLGQGTGLGLSISRDIVTRAGGRIRAENVEPRGARFSIELAAAQGTEATAREAGRRMDPAADAQPTVRLSILVVDDEAEVLRALQRVLSPRFEVMVAHSGDEARAELAAGRVVDILLCDLMMPHGSGLDLLDWICEKRPELVQKFILMTGGGLERQQLALAHPAHPRLLAKPFGLDDLLEVINRG